LVKIFLDRVESNEPRKSRDERKAEDLKIPFTVDQIVYTPVDSFNEMLTQYPLSSEQQLLIKDIRRRGKNKIAAQNCRKRKVETISQMQEDVELLRRKKKELLEEQEILLQQRMNITAKYNLFQNQVFPSCKSTSNEERSQDDFFLNESISNDSQLLPSSLEEDPRSSSKLHFPHKRNF